MNLHKLFFRSFRILLFPISLLYGLGVVFRNVLYDTGLLKSASFQIPVICVGNLSIGGTGKSPMVEYLCRRLKDGHHPAILSRGYKRRTRGYLLAGAQTTAVEIGDEPMQFHIKFPDITVAVGESRTEAVPRLLFDRPETDLIILDDAFQHRAIHPGLNIVLTDCHNLYTRDFFLPTGDLRDQRSSARRADAIVVTKCDPEMNIREAEDIRRELKLAEHQRLFFTSIRYGIPFHIGKGHQYLLDRDTEVLLVCGIANPEPLTSYLGTKVASCAAIYFRDHHIFTMDDIHEIRERFESMRAGRKIILTTEKDSVRLSKFGETITALPVYVLPISVLFKFSGEAGFNKLIDNFIRSKKKD
jgi:tetraacyldisaccharide 4'-kinase